MLAASHISSTPTGLKPARSNEGIAPSLPLLRHSCLRRALRWLALSARPSSTHCIILFFVFKQMGGGYTHKSEISHKINFGIHKTDLHQAKNIQKLPAINRRTLFIIPFFSFKIIKNRQKLHSSESVGCSSTWTPRWVFQTAQSPIY